MNTVVIEADGLETIDACLYRNQLSTNNINVVLSMLENKHLSDLSVILPPRTQITVPVAVENIEIKRIRLWD